MSRPSLADLMDYTGRNERRRKQRLVNRDTREPGGRDHWTLTDIVLQGRGYTIDRHALRIGDYSWPLRPESALHGAGYRETVIERKKLSDLRDVERLQNQLNRAYRAMVDEDSRMFFIVLIDYTADPDDPRAWTDEQILNAELSIQLGGHFKVTRSGPGLLADRIDSLYNYTQKNSHSIG